MLDIEATIQKFGYSPLSLSVGSHKKIVMICDYCQSVNEIVYKSYNHGRKIVEKDACIKCKFIKREDVGEKKHGVRHSTQRPEVRKKLSEKAIIRQNSPEFKEKIKNIMLEKYGVESSFQSEQIKEKIKATMLEKYGVEYCGSSPELLAKSRQTCLERYGDIHSSKTEIGKQKIKEGFQKKFGVDNCFQNEEIKEKIKNSRIKNGSMRVYDGKTMSQIAEELGFSHGYINDLIRKYGMEIAMKMEPTTSRLELMITNWLDSINIQYIQHFRVDKKVADIYIPSHKLIIETDGIYWHSEVWQKDNKYHIKKRQLYIDNGYIPLFFRENELEDSAKFTIIKSIILNKLGMVEKIGARKCKIVKIDKKIANKFFAENHLMGKGAGDSYGLEYDGKLVTAIRIKQVKDGYEISRFCHLLNTNVVGGISRLIKYVCEQIIPNKNLTTFVDLRYGSGEYLKNFGFTQEKTYPSFKWTNGPQVFNRMKFPASTGYSKGLVKIWDCGQAKFVKYSSNGV